MIRIVAKHRWLTLLLGLSLLSWSFVPGSQRLDHWLYAYLTALMPVSETPINTLMVTLESGPTSYQSLAEVLTHLQSAGVAAVGVSVPLHRAQTRISAKQSSRLRKLLNSRQDAAASQQLWRQLDPDATLQAALASTQGLVLAVPPGMGEIMPTLSAEVPDKELTWLLPLLLPPEMITSKLFPSASQNLESSRTSVTPLAIFSASATLATSTLFDSNLSPVLVSAPLVVPRKDDLISSYTPSFELALAATALRVPMGEIKVHIGRGVTLGASKYATDAGLQFYPPVQAAVTPFPRLSATQLLDGKLSNKQLQGKTVLVGLADDPATPRSILPGAKLDTRLAWSAQVVNALLNASFISTPYWSLGLQRAAIILILIYLILLPARLRGTTGLMVSAGISFLLLNGELWFLILRNTHLPLALPMVFLLFGHGFLSSHHHVAGHYYRLRDERDAALVDLANNLRSQGQLDQADERLKVCAESAALREAMYQLGLDFERRRQFNKALMVYERIAEQDNNFRDVAERRARHQQTPDPSQTVVMNSYASTTLVVDDPKVERPLLGRYEIEREIGRGAMGTVYLGRDPRISRTVAIKTLALTEEFESDQLEEIRRRFFQEAETAGRLNHPSIVTIYDVGEEHDLAYIAMDYISGDSLDQHTQQDALLPIEQVFNIGVQVAEALDYAHQQKVVHRDVKPGNIIFDLDKEQLKVTDFGIACLTDNSKTRTGTVLGSPFYMSPEQIAGKKVDGRSDLFSLGVTLYQLFTGQLPFEGESLTTLMYQITNGKPKAIRKLRPELPTCVTRLINKSLEKSPAKRYASGQAMAEAIKRCMEQWDMG